MRYGRLLAVQADCLCALPCRRLWPGLWVKSLSSKLVLLLLKAVVDIGHLCSM